LIKTFLVKAKLPSVGLFSSSVRFSRFLKLMDIELREFCSYTPSHTCPIKAVKLQRGT
jgi:hypothetical protein